MGDHPNCMAGLGLHDSLGGRYARAAAPDFADASADDRLDLDFGGHYRPLCGLMVYFATHQEGCSPEASLYEIGLTQASKLTGLRSQPLLDGLK